MKTGAPSHFSRERAPAAAGAFSLVEIIIVVGLLSVIMLGLLMMFNQTQRAFRTSMTQTDVLGSGRAASAMLNAALEQMTPSRRGGSVVNFYMTNYSSAGLPPVLQSMPGIANARRSNILESVYFLSRENQQWVGTGFMVGTPAAGFGTLYRIITNCPVNQDPAQLYAGYQFALANVYYNSNPMPSFISRVADGVIHFKVRVFNTNGYYITNTIISTNPIVPTLTVTNITVDAPDLAIYGGEAREYKFTDASVPASVEFEIGILEDRALSKLRAIPDTTFQRRQLTNQVGVAAVHIFRQRVPVPLVDISAYQ